MILRRALISAGIAALIGVVVALYGTVVAHRIDKPQALDFSKFYVSAQKLLSGGDIYQPVPMDYFGPLLPGIEFDRDYLHPNLNMPVVALLFAPFSLGSVASGMAAWSVFAVGLVLASAALLGSQFVASRGLSAFDRWMISGLLAFLMLAHYPTFAGLVLGQLGQLLLFILCAAWLAARRGQDRLAGVLLGTALALKLLTAVFLLLLPWLGRWRLLRWYVGTFLALTLLGAVTAGPGSYLRYLTVLQEVDWYATGWNASLMAPLSILFGGGGAPSWLDFPGLATPFSAVISASLYALLVIAVRKVADPETKLDLTIAGAVPLMLLASPLGWLYYFPLLWITVSAVIEAVHPRHSHWAWWLFAAFVMLVSGLPYTFIPGEDATESLQTILVTSADTVALLLALALVLAAAWRIGTPRQAAA